MSEQWSEFGSEPSSAESEGTASSSANGANPPEAAGALDGSSEESLATNGEATDESAEEALASGDEAAGESAALAEPAGEASVIAVADTDAATSAEPAESDGEGAAEPVDGVAATATDDVSAEAPDEVSVFLADLVRAMQATAGLERARIGEEIERRRQAHIDEVRAREAAEADRMRELADDDMKAIEAWADGENKRIQLERERRATALHEDLDLSLAQHHSKIDREIEGVEAAIATYREEVDAFFVGLDRETDPVRIAQQAASRPIFPTMGAAAETVAATSAEPAPAEPAVVGVMDPLAADEPVEAWAAPAATTPEPGLAPAGSFGDSDPEGAAGDPVDLVAAGIGQGDGGSGTLLKSVTVKRPMSWLRRDTNGGDHTNGDG